VMVTQTAADFVRFLIIEHRFVHKL
jgi:hypothetical protein